jgi:hypothetical protein
VERGPGARREPPFPVKDPGHGVVGGEPVGTCPNGLPRGQGDPVAGVQVVGQQPLLHLLESLQGRVPVFGCHERGSACADIQKARDPVTRDQIRQAGAEIKGLRGGIQIDLEGEGRVAQGLQSLQIRGRQDGPGHPTGAHDPAEGLPRSHPQEEPHGALKGMSSQRAHHHHQGEVLHGC